MSSCIQFSYIYVCVHVRMCAYACVYIYIYICMNMHKVKLPTNKLVKIFKNVKFIYIKKID